MLDEREFFGPYGIRSVSRVHLDQPFKVDVGNAHYEVGYLPAESDSGMFGGNSNWRGPVWMPVNVLIVRALLEPACVYGDDFTSNVRPVPGGA
jgi:glycogen debranching enzyme